MRPRELLAAARARGRTALDEPAGKQVLTAYGIPVPRARVVVSPAEVAAAFDTLTPPVVVKGISPDVIHKSEAGAVRLRITSAAAAVAAAEAILLAMAAHTDRVEGFLVEEMAAPGQELVIGGVIDPQFGPLVMLGLGGIFVEVFADVAFRICPITPRDAGEMLDELRAAPVLKGARGRTPVRRDYLTDVLLRVGGERGLLWELRDEIAELDINPLIVSPHGAVAADARMVLARTAAAAA
ncbi:MAG: acetyl-CoA synthetase [Alphaproteobacteria bacterium]|nr:acetyl-CoA synthetase [Alphaproteobacteria bacterium]